MDTPKFTCKFVGNANIIKPSKEQALEAKASIQELSTVFPLDVFPETDPDLVYIFGNLAVGGLINLNDDGISTDTALAIYKKFEKRQCNVEHDRTKVCGYILKSFLSEFGTSKPITEEEARSSNKPFNISTLAVLWKVVNKELCDWVVQNTDENNPNKNDLSLSFEVGFNKYQIVELNGENPDISQAEKIIFENSKEFPSYDASLRQNGGSGKKNGNKIGRILWGDIVPLGQGIVTTPAAAVKGIFAVNESPLKESSQESVNNIMDKEIKSGPNPFVPQSVPQYGPPATAEKVIKSYRVAIPDDWKAHLQSHKAFAMNDMCVDVSLEGGEKISNVPVYDGHLDMKELLDKKIITSINICEVKDSTNIDNSSIIYPNIDKEYPTVDEETQKKNRERLETKEWIQNQPYTDAILKNLEIAGKNINKYSVLNKTEKNIMDITKFKELAQTVKTSEDVGFIKEAVANAALFADEIAKKSEELFKNAEASKNLVAILEAQKKEVEASNLEAKKEMEALKEKLQAMHDMHLAAEKEAKFSDRMNCMVDIFSFTDEEKAAIAKRIKAMDDDSFAEYLTESKMLMKEKTKAFKNEQAAKMKDLISSVSKGGKVDINFDEVIGSAKDNPINKDIIDNSLDTSVSLKERMKAAFAKDFKIGNQTLEEIEKQSQLNK